MKKISIVGFGRFGKTLHRLIKDDFVITLYNRSKIEVNPAPTTLRCGVNTAEFTKNTIIAKDIDEVYKSDAIFYAVPISAFEQVISSHIKYVRSHHVLIDVLSVKLYAAKVFNKYIKDRKAQALLTHPMFGPDSSKNGFEGLPMIIDKFRTETGNYDFWKNYFKSKKLSVVEMSAREHDKIAANSQGLTHFVGRLLGGLKFRATSIDSVGTKKLLQVVEQTCNDSWQLFADLQHYNPYTKQMRLGLGEAYDRLYNKLLPKYVNPPFITYGVQGGRGSFNEEAILYFLKRGNTTKYKVKYLYTSENVLASLYKGEIDRGQFAIHNSVGGIVEESIQAMAKYKFNIIDQFAIKISHALMIRSDADISEVATIMSHPQVFAQCRDTLSKKYPYLKQISGEGELIDHAMVAKHLSENKLPKSMATMGSGVLAKLYNLKVIEDNLQDAKENYTSFLLVSR